MRKRLLASILAVAMMLTMAPFAFAAEDTIVEASGSELQNRINNATSGQTIKLTENTTADITIPADKNIVLDLGGNILTNTNAGKATLTVEKDATATVQNGSIVGGTSHYNIAVGTEAAPGGTLTLNNVTATAGNDGSSMIDNWGTLTINSGTYTGGLDVVKSEEASTLTINNGTFTLTKGSFDITGVIWNYGNATINGGTFKQASTATGARVVVTGQMEGYTSITKINDGTFTNVKGIILHPTDGASYSNFEVLGGTFNKSIPSYYLQRGYAVAKSGSSYVIKTAVMNVTLNETTLNLKGGQTFKLVATPVETNVDIKTVSWSSRATDIATVNSSTGLVTAKKAGSAEIVAKPAGSGATLAVCRVTIENGDVSINTTPVKQYPTLQEAFTNGQTKKTITLLNDVTGEFTVPAGKNFTLDLNGHTITSSGDTIINNGTLTITDSQKTGAIVSTGNVAVFTKSGATTTINYAKVTGQEGALGFTGEVTGATLIVNDGVFTGVDNAVVISNGSDRDGDANTITINGGTFEGKIQSKGYVACGIFAPWKDIVTVNGGTFNITNGAGIVARAGNVTVNGGTFNTTGNITGMVGDSRVVVPCSAIVFDSDAKYPAMTADSKITVTGGTFNSKVDAISTVSDKARVSVSGGVYSSDVNDYAAPGYKADKTNGVWVVKSGTNDALAKVDEAIKDDASPDDIKAAVEAVTNTPNETLSSSSTTMDKLAELEKKVTNNQITVQTNSNVSEVSNPTATNAKLSADPEATTDQKITIDVTASNVSVDEAKDLVGATDEMAAKALDITMKLNGNEITPKAPVVLTFDLPTDWANAKIVYMNGNTPELVKTSVSKDANGKATISGTFDHFSTYILVQTAATANPNAYTLTLEPNVNDVAAGDTIKYTVKLTHTSGNTNDKVARLIFNPVVDDEILELDTTQSVGAQGVTFAKDGDGKYQFTFQSNVDLANGDSMNIGTLAYTAKAYAKTTAINVSGNEETRVTNATGYREGAPVTVETSTNVTYHVTTVTFKNADGSLTTFYVPYEGNGTQFYNDLNALYKRTSAQAIPQAVDGSVTNGTQYRLKYNGTNDSNSDNWYLSTDSNKGKYSSATIYSVDTTYEVNRVKLLELTLPKTPTVKLDDNVTTTVKDGKIYVDEGADLIFTIDGTPSAGKKFDVTVEDGGTKVDGVINNNGTWTAPGNNLTNGPVEIKVEEVLALTADDIGIFKVTAEGVDGYQPFSTYSGNKTLVLIKGDSSAKYSLTGGPEIYALLDKAYINESDESYTHAVLIDPTNVDFGKDKMLAHLTDDLQLKAESGENTTISYDWDTNGLPGPKLDDVQATFDFKSLKDNELKWEPTDEMLLKADVMNLADGGNVYDNGSYKTQRDGVVTDNDVYAFMYLYVRIAGGNTN